MGHSRTRSAAARVTATRTNAPNAARRKTAPEEPISSNSVVASAEPHWTETIEARTSSAAPRVRAVSPEVVEALAIGGF